MAVRALPASEQYNHAQVVQVAVGRSHTLLLTDEGVLYSWGSDNDLGQLGRICVSQAKMMEPSPLIAGLKQEIIIQIACGMNHCLALTQRGVLFAWGQNKAGQLGIEGFSTSAQVNDLVEKTPTHVKYFGGQEGSLLARSCSCGPESSACVTTKGEIYVWGAISYYLFGATKKYQRGENCTVPVCVRGMPQGPADLGVDQVSVYKATFAANISKMRIEDDLVNLIASLKARSVQLATVIRMKRAELNERPAGSGGDDGMFGLEELRLLNNDFQQARKALQAKNEEMEKQLLKLREELSHVNRELTVSDQQDVSLSETARQLEVKRDVVGDNASHKRALESKLHDISHFQSSNQRKRLQLLNVRDEKERQVLQTMQELTMAVNQQQQLDSRSRMIRSLQGDAIGSAGGSGDDGLRVADSKRQELASTEPSILSGIGRFINLQEILTISERSLQDVLSSLKEVRAASSEGGDGLILEAVLEANLELRRQLNVAYEEKRSRAEHGRLEGGLQEMGMLQFFQEAKGPPPPSGEQKSTFSAGLSMFGWGSG